MKIIYKGMTCLGFNGDWLINGKEYEVVDNFIESNGTVNVLNEKGELTNVLLKDFEIYGGTK